MGRMRTVLPAAQRPVVQRLGLGKAQQRVLPCMLGELSRLSRCAMALEVGGAGQNTDLAGAHGTGVQGGVLEHPDAKCHVGALFDQVNDAFVRIQLQFHLGVALAKSGYQRHQHMQHEGRGRIDPQPTGWPQPPGRHLLLGLIDRSQDGTGVLEEGGAFLGQLQSACGAAQQRGLQLFLEAAQRAAGGRDRQAQQLRGSGDRARVHHGRKGLQFIEGGLHY